MQLRRVCAARWARIAGGPAARVRLAAMAQDPGTDKGVDILAEEDAGDTCDEEVSGLEDVDPKRGSGAAGAMLDVRAFFRVFLATHRRRVYGSIRVFGQKVMYTVLGAGRRPGGSNQLVLGVLHLFLRARRLFPLAACCVPLRGSYCLTKVYAAWPNYSSQVMATVNSRIERVASSAVTVHLTIRGHVPFAPTQF